MRVTGIALSLLFGVLFWVAIDATGATHVPFDFFDSRTLYGLAAWMCVVASVQCYEIGRKKP